MAYLQRSSVAAATGTPLTATLTLTSTTSGSTIIVAIAQSGSGTRTYTVSDDVNPPYSLGVSNNPTNSRGAHVYYKHNNEGGTLTITVVVNVGTAAFDAVAFEVSGLDTAASPVTSSFTDPAVDAAHPCSADATSIDTTGAAFLVTATALSGVSSTQTRASGWDEGVVGTNGARYFQRYSAGTALSDVRGTWVQTGTDRQGVSVIAAFPVLSGGGGGGGVTASGIALTWFGR